MFACYTCSKNETVKKNSKSKAKATNIDLQPICKGRSFGFVSL